MKPGKICIEGKKWLATVIIISIISDNTRFVNSPVIFV